MTIKAIHVLIFFFLIGCVFWTAYSAIRGYLGAGLWIASAGVIVEGVILLFSGGKCPLTEAAERKGATSGSVADLFLPKWFADRIFVICGLIFLISWLGIGWQILAK